MKIKVSNPKTLLALTAVSALLSCAGFKVLAGTTDYSQIPGMPKIELMTGNDRWGCEVLLCLANPNGPRDRKSTRLNSSHANESRMPSSA